LSKPFAVFTTPLNAPIPTPLINPKYPFHQGP